MHDANSLRVLVGCRSGMRGRAEQYDAPRRTAPATPTDGVAARKAGVSVDAMAAQVRVGAATVSGATSQYGPFPPHSPDPARVRSS